MPDVFLAPEENEQNERLLRSRTMPDGGSQNEVVTSSLVETEIQPPLVQTPVKNTQSANTQPEQTTNKVPLFTSFWKDPQGIYFESQEIDEHIALFLRRHFITNLPWVVATLVLLLLPFIGMYLLSLGYTITILPAPFITAIVGVYYLFVLTNAFLHFYNWYYNITIITPKRVLDIEVADLMDKKISATPMSHVQDITYEQIGAIRSLFDYGDVLIQTAGTIDNFHVESVPNPEVVVETMNGLVGLDNEEGGVNHA